MQKSGHVGPWACLRKASSRDLQGFRSHQTLPLFTSLYLNPTTYKQSKYSPGMGLLRAFQICKNYIITKMYIKYKRIRNIMKLASRAMASAYNSGISAMNSVYSYLVPICVQVQSLESFTVAYMQGFELGEASLNTYRNSTSTRMA